MPAWVLRASRFDAFSNSNQIAGFAKQDCFNMTCKAPGREFKLWIAFAVVFLGLATREDGQAQEDALETWKFQPELLQPFWEGNQVLGESVLFIKDQDQKEARGQVLFPIDRVLQMSSSDGKVIYEEGRDYIFTGGTRELILPEGSRVVSRLASELRVPPKTQKYELTHRDGNGEILFGAKLEYHNMQTSISYVASSKDWPIEEGTAGSTSLPKTAERLANGKPLSIVVLGDSISTGCNASAWGKGAPFQPAYQDLVRLQLRDWYSSPIELSNLSVSGTTSGWGLSQVDRVIELHPNLVVLAFGMNDSAGVSPEDYSRNIASIIRKIRESDPECEFILIATMLGNRDWVRLKHESFPQFRSQLQQLTESGVALADLTTVWDEMLKRKKDWDLTGNGVNHPNDFGHRVYAQVILKLLSSEK
jgi:acyl-CoA thioesterase-1